MHHSNPPPTTDQPHTPSPHATSTLPPELLDRTSIAFSQLLATYFHDTAALHDAAVSAGLSLQQYALWRDTPVAQAAIDQVVNLDRQRAQDLAARAASHAVQLLTAQLLTKPDSEQGRKAATTLLRLAFRRGGTGLQPVSGAQPPPPDAPGTPAFRAGPPTQPPSPIPPDPPTPGTSQSSPHPQTSSRRAQPTRQRVPHRACHQSASALRRATGAVAPASPYTPPRPSALPPVARPNLRGLVAPSDRWTSGYPP